MGYAWAGSSTDRNRMACEVSLGDGSENAVFFVANVYELNLAVAAQRVNDGIQSVSNNSIATFDSGIYKHLPQQVCNFSRHKTPPKLKFRVDGSTTLNVEAKCRSPRSDEKLRHKRYRD